MKQAAQGTFLGMTEVCGWINPQLVWIVMHCVQLQARLRGRSDSGVPPSNLFSSASMIALPAALPATSGCACGTNTSTPFH